MAESFARAKYPQFSIHWYLAFLLACFTTAQQEGRLESLYRNMQYPPGHEQYIPAITLRRYLQFAEADDDPSYRRVIGSRLDFADLEQVKILYSNQVGGEQVFNLPKTINNISKIQRADLVIKDYDHNFERVRVSPPTGSHTQKLHFWKIAKWTVEGHALNVTHRLYHHLSNGHKTIRFRVCVKNRKRYLRCGHFNKFSIALVIQINLHLDFWKEFSMHTPYTDVLDKLVERETYRIRIKRSENQEMTEIPSQNTPAPIGSSAEHLETNLCHVHPWTVSFTEIGWSYVSNPTSFHANVCVGGCPTPLYDHTSMKYSHHSGVVDLYRMYHNVSRHGIPPDVCCTASEMAPLSISYVEDDANILVRLDGIRVTACSCR
ncbi:bone morphogenetic protein 15-like [Ylistrum balloti]|uniref:bone morphogenetic protein 15-like n=1 Tax=Ylistrum balloti TaxID=509963 RepID=UPI002905EF80|nr:bone morphogenetic protein 15-like [Ylistrum balloti]